MKFIQHEDYEDERQLAFSDDHDELMIAKDGEGHFFIYVNGEGPVWLKPKQAHKLAKALIKETAK